VLIMVASVADVTADLLMMQTLACSLPNYPHAAEAAKAAATDLAARKQSGATPSAAGPAVQEEPLQHATGPGDGSVAGGGGGASEVDGMSSTLGEVAPQ